MTPSTLPPTQPLHNTPENAPALLTDEKKNIDFDLYLIRQKRRISKSLEGNFFCTAKALLDEIILTDKAHSNTEQKIENTCDYTDVLNRLVGMNKSIALNYPESTSYADPDMITWVVRGV